MRLAIIGLGKMGGNMARRLCRGNIEVVGFNRSSEIVNQLAKEEGMIAAESAADAIKKLSAPRVVWIMLPDGKPTEDMIKEVTPLLEKGDVIIEGGNSNYHDTQRRGESLAENNIHYVDVGTSGGIWGLDNGYCMMVGGEKEAVSIVTPILKVLAPGPETGWAHVGPTGSGHFTKMVHNGIEYGMMQAFAEGFALIRGKKEFNVDLAELAEIWRTGSVVRSWLLDLTAESLANDQDLKDIQDLEPNLAPVFERGIFQRDSLWLSDPHRVVQGMVDLFIARGGTFKQFDVHSVDFHDERIMLGDTTNSMRADKAVICAGAWSKPLARQLGDKLPMDTERGYHLMLPAENNRLLKRPVMSGEHSFVLVPMDNGLRLTGLVELADLDAPPDYRLIRRLIPAALKMLPGINGAEESVWMGCRPSLPDSLPVIGVSRRSKNVLYAFGHQHLGITLGPASGLIISDMIAGRDPGLDLQPYRPDRF